MRQHLLTILILLPVFGALAAVGYSFVPRKQEAHYKWIALGVTILNFALSLLLVSALARPNSVSKITLTGLELSARATTWESTELVCGWYC